MPGSHPDKAFATRSAPPSASGASTSPKSTSATESAMSSASLKDQVE